MTKKINLFANLKSDFASGLVVFLVALPLCLGIALASGAPLFSGIISGIVGGIVVGYLSQSHISVSGPAAGLTAIVLTAITDLGAFNVFLLAVLIAGIIQLALGFLRAGSISNYFPTNVIEGMLAGIGVIIILKQIPHAFGYDADYEGDETFTQADGQNTFSELFNIIDFIHPGAVIITIISLIILIMWPKVDVLKRIKLVPPALVAVIVSILLNEFFIITGNSLAISQSHLVSLPVPTTLEEFKSIIILPDFTAITNSKVWVVAFTIAVVASIETLLCIEAADRMDALKRHTNTNIELKAQGIGNVVSSLLGGLPMTSVVVRTSANNDAGAKSKMSSIIHGVLLLISVLAIPVILNKIPLATLAAVLLMVGYKLAVPNIKHFADYMPKEVNLLLISLVLVIIGYTNSVSAIAISALAVITVFILLYCFYKSSISIEFKKNVTRNQYIYFPFFATTLAVVFTDLLKGVALGMIISIIFVLRGNMQRAYNFRKEVYKDGDIIHIDLAQEVSFLNKAAVKTTLNSIPDNSKVIINASDTVYIAHDVLDLIKEFKKIKAKEQNIKVKLIGFKKVYELENTDETSKKNVFVEQKPSQN
ncbi:MAG: SulP family inorganic anion transporter [Flavobacterium sp.]|jgi:MFS superfamily sulfate permease-like transporter|uniref:SulP family inorganic anion transporter n=1 Tax=Flavobacterium TaxID=237 RepID=UPI0022C7FF74|nr:SulP family inorganic anion transporter [Flavobacterium sp.]MCZ8089899.1 SulP family inorganic anion transporter [Flavobacterium sp.]MCZ8332162.1 SulP family inorganic anion transporter [Flavobacterium sp.]